MKMRRIASFLLLLKVVFFIQCTNSPVDPEPGPGPNPVEKNNITLKIHVPKSNLSTYAEVDATVLENRIDTLFVDLYQNGTELIKQDTFPEPIPNINTNDSIVTVGYEVDNITSPPLRVEVFANSRTVKVLNPPTDSIPLPIGDRKTSFFMSGKANLEYKDGSYQGEVRVIRNVAKVRVKVSKHTVILPSDLEIDYDKTRIKTINIANKTSLFGDETDKINAATEFVSTSTRTGDLLHKSPAFSNDGQIDSFYVYENIRNDFSLANETQVEVSITTKSLTTGTKGDEYTYSLYTNGSYNIERNYIYTLDIKVRGQSLEPVITTSIQPWDDDNVDGTIHGTYLTIDKSEITFDTNGEATINFCSDAQAIYFDFEEFKKANPGVRIGLDSVIPIGIDTSNLALAPEGFKDGQILLDKQHCGSFGFKLDLDKFPEFPNVNFSGNICIRAGNIVKCLSFPGIRTYDAHFIVGDTLFNVPGETYKSATVTNGGTWLHVSKNRLYVASEMMDKYPPNSSSGSTKLYLHLDENLTGSLRTGSVTVTTNDDAEKTIHISQLPAIPVGRFGYNSHTSTEDDSIYSTTLYTEQLYEFKTMPKYITGSSFVVVPGNAIYNGRMTAITSGIFNWSIYDNNSNYFNYQNELYEAINYCAYKNRITGQSPNSDDFKWYLPSQAQLMGMWLSYASYKDEATSNFKREGKHADVFWSSTDNKDYANYAQYMNFKFGNSGHIASNSQLWVRCVRDSIVSNPSASMIINDNGSSVIDFGIGMPAGSYTTTPKDNGAAGDELSNNNKTLYKKLRVALTDHASGVAWNINTCPSVWRLPTQRELQAIWILQSEIKYKVPAFTLLADDYYWSATDATGMNGTNAWAIFGSRSNPGTSGNAPHLHKVDSRLRVRCVKEE
jgi:hypothetical protein